MTVVGLYGCKQAPGVTTLALALASALDADGGAVVLEVDPQGGDLAALLGAPSAPGLVTLAAAGRHGGTVDLEEHVRALPTGGRALLAPTEPAQVAAACRAVADRLVAFAAATARHVVVDHGRSVDPLDGEEIALLMCHPTVAGVEQARVRGDALDAVSAEVAIIISASGPYRADEVAAVLGRPVLGTVPHDPRGMAALTGSGRGARRSPLVRSAATVADALRSLGDHREPAW